MCRACEELLYLLEFVVCEAIRCQFGQTAPDGRPIMKPTGFMSNSELLLQQLNKLCRGKNGKCGGYRASEGQVIIGVKVVWLAKQPFTQRAYAKPS